MDSILYNWTGILTENLSNTSAIRIQRAYRNHRGLEMQWRENIINRRASTYDSDIVEDANVGEELMHWHKLREKVKYDAQALRDAGWMYI